MKKSFTPAESKRLLDLANIAQQENRQLDNFVAFLREQHDAKNTDWTLLNDGTGFEKPDPQEKPKK